MTPNEASDIHRFRTELAKFARQHGWEVRTPNSDPTWIFLELTRRESSLTAEWSDDLPTGCQLIGRVWAIRNGAAERVNVRPDSPTIRQAIEHFDSWILAASTLADSGPPIVLPGDTIDLDVLDLRDGE